jgi:hypothetical protein
VLDNKLMLKENSSIKKDLFILIVNQNNSIR